MAQKCYVKLEQPFELFEGEGARGKKRFGVTVRDQTVADKGLELGGLVNKKDAEALAQALNVAYANWLSQT